MEEASEASVVTEVLNILKASEGSEFVPYINKLSWPNERGVDLFTEDVLTQTVPLSEHQ